ncbi:MAG: RAMP superfamily CRISPR-associated protein [Desulfonauticus sp.]|nr:RAMP superfamily CRISPR-associated protein [Desulfonauticus sp.]
MLDNSKKIYAIATDPIYIGTGGYTIGRVDNTIVRDPITKIPKIPGSSLAGTWRYYVALELISKVKDYQPDFNTIKNRSESSLVDKIKNEPWKNGFSNNRWLSFYGNKIAKITCAGQDNLPQETLAESPFKTDKDGNTGHCGHCIVCKAFGFSKKDCSWQGMLFFSDFNILFFPVYTRLGVKWISSQRILKEAGILNNGDTVEEKEIVCAQEQIEDTKREGYINLGWLNFPYKIEKLNIDLSSIVISSLAEKDIIIVPDSLISQIINSNLEVRTSVSIDPITGAAKEKALFTSEAIPRGTIFYGNIRLFDKTSLGDNNLPEATYIWNALEDAKKYYNIFGIGGMTTRGFGRMKILTELSSSSSGNNSNHDDNGGGNEDGQ